VNRPALLIDVAGPVRGQGCTTVAEHLALAFARAGRRVALIEGRQRGPLASSTPRTGDLGAVISLLTPPRASTPLSAHQTDDDRLIVVTPDRRVNEGATPIESVDVAARLAELRASCDVIVVDSSCFLSDPDALAWAKIADITLLVARLGHTTGSELRHGVDLLRGVGAPLSRIVVNSGTLDEFGYPRP
jgi:Mrp family chromosome partitioning ATPase